MQRRRLACILAAALPLARVGWAETDEGNIDSLVLHQTKQHQRLTSQPVGAINAGADQVAPRVSEPTLQAVTDATWIGLGNSTSWFNASNWSTATVPDGVGAIARFSAVSAGPVVQLGTSSITLAALEMSDPLFSSIVGGTINLNGQSTIHADKVNFDLPSRVYTFPSGDPSTGITGNSIGGLGSYATSMVGSLGLNKTGDSHLQIDSPQFFTGTVTINEGGKLISTVGDAAFGDAGNAMVLNNGTVQASVTNWITSRNIHVTPAGGSIYWVDSTRFGYSGNITGNGSLEINGVAGQPGEGTISSAQSFAGTLTFGGGTLIINGGGAFTSVPSIHNAGTLIFENNVGANPDRIGDSTAITLRGSALTVRTTAAAYNETAGNLSLDGGVSFVSLVPSGGGVQLNLGDLSRANGASVVFRGANLGSAPGANNTNVFLANGTSLLVKGIIPFAYANPSFTQFFSLPETPDNVLVTYGANGVTPITSYASSFAGSTSNTNVRIESGTTVGGVVNANALVIAAPAEYFDDTPVTIGGSGTINLDSGVLLSANSGFTSAGSFNSLPGNVVNANLNFGAREAVIMTPSAITLNGVISGTGGLTKIGGRTAVFAGANTYTGTTTLNGLVRFASNVLADGVTPGPFGRDTSPIVLYGGNTSANIPGANTFAGSANAHLGSASPGSVTFNRRLEARGDNVFLRSFSTGTVVWAGNINLPEASTNLWFASSTEAGHQVVTGVISGSGHVQGGSTSAGGAVWLDLMGANTFTGGLDLSGGTVGIGDDNALGAGSVTISDASRILAIGGARILANNFVHYSGTFSIGGSQPITLSGEINGRGGDYLLNVSNAATTTFAGPMTGGSVTKLGTGTLVIAGTNTTGGLLSVGDGITPGGMVILKSDTAAGSSLGPTYVRHGANTLALDGSAAATGSILIAEEPLFLFGDGNGNLGSLRNLAGDNTWGGIVRPVAVYNQLGNVVSQSATVGVDADSLTIDSVIIVADPGVNTGSGSVQFLANSIGLTKRGAGTLYVGSDVISSNVGSNSFLWNGAIVASGSLDIQAGTVRLKTQSGVATISNGRAVIDIGSLNIAGGPGAATARLDLADGALVVDYDDASPLSEIRQFILQGYGGGNWGGNGITSSRAFTSPNPGEAGRTSIGYAEASAISTSVFVGNPVDSTSVLVRYTYEGDTNLDGVVDIADLGALATSWQSSGAWHNGDFDYSGFVDITDLGKLASNWQAGISPGAATLDLSLAMANVGMGGIAVPEPAAGILMFTPFLLRRRRRLRDISRYDKLSYE